MEIDLSQYSTETLREASDMGWIHPDHYKGSPDKYIPPDEFIERGKNFIPILRKNNEKLQNQLGAIQSDLARTKSALSEAVTALADFKKFHEESAKMAYQRARADLLNQKKSAMKEGDTDRVVDIEEAISTLDKRAATVPEIKTPTKEETPQIDPTMQQWIAQNAPWYGKDMKKTAYANAIAVEIREQNPNVVGLDFLQLVSDATDEQFTERQSRSKVETPQGGTGEPPRGKKLTEADMTSEEKKVFERYVPMVVGKGKAYADRESFFKVFMESARS